MKTHTLIKILKKIECQYGLATRTYIDAIDSPDANFVVVEVWESDNVDVYVTDNDEDFICNHCIDDDDTYMYGLKEIKVYKAIGNSIEEYETKIR